MGPSPRNPVELHRRAKALFEEVCELSPQEGRSRLAQRCAGDAELLELVRGMLEADQADSEFLEGSVPGRIEAAEREHTREPPTIPGFRLVRPLGEGASGTVWEAEQVEPRRRVAVKLLRDWSIGSASQARFALEGEILGRLRHPGIAQVFTVGSTGGGRAGSRRFIALELVEGLPLEQHARRGKLPLRARLELLLQVCEAVSHAHDQGVVHRDLKSSNVLVDAEGRAKVLDFGIARLLDDEERGFRTRTGEVLGTLAYMSPEQASGTQAVDERADVYALGAMLYQLASGRLPIDVEGVDMLSALRRIELDEPTLLGALDPRLRGDVEVIACAALEKDPARRYPTAAALADDLRRHLADEAIRARSPSQAYLLRKWARRHRALSTGLAVAAAALVVGGVLVGRAWYHEAHQRRVAEARGDALAAANYRAKIRIAQLALDTQQPSEAQRALEEAAPGHRGWEWRLLHAEAVPELARHTEVTPVAARDLGEDRALLLASDGSTWTWDALADELAPLGPPAAPSATVLALGPQGRRVLLHEAGRLVLRDVDGTERARVPDTGAVPIAEPGHCALDPEGRWAVVTTGRTKGDEAVERVSLDDGASREIQTVSDKVRSLHIDPAGRVLAVSEGTWLTTYDLDSGEQLVRYEHGEKRAGYGGAVEFQGPEHLLHPCATAFETLGVRTASREPGPALPTPFVRLLGLHTRDERRLLWLLSGELQILDRRTGALLGRHLPPGGASAAAWVADGEALLAAPAAEPGFRIDLVSDVGRVLELGSENPYDLSYHPSGAVILTGDVADGSLCLWSPVTGELLARTVLSEPVQSARFSPDGERLAVATTTRLLLYELGRAGPRAEIEKVRVRRLDWSPDGSRLAVSTYLRLLLLDGRDGELVRDSGRGYPTWACRFDPTGSALAVGGRVGVELLDGGTGQPFAGPTASAPEGSGDLDPVEAVAFMPGGDLVVGHASGRLERLSLPRLERRISYVGHTAEVFGIAVSRDGSRIFSAGRDGVLRVHDAAAPQPLLALRRHTGYVRELAREPGGETVATVSADGTLRLWNPTPARARWREQRAVLAARAEAGPQVESLRAERGGLVPALRALRAGVPELPMGLRTAALEEVLRRAFEASFPEQ